ncbi:MFS transporter [Chloroflexota bacterium]
MKKPPFFYGYVIVAAGFLIQAAGVGTMVSFGVFFKPLLNEFGWSRATLSGVQAIALFFGGFLGIIIGRLNDRFGPRLMMIVTGSIFGLAIYLMSDISNVWQLYLVYGLLLGLGRSAIDVIPMSSAARWFVRRRGIMTGAMRMGTGMGQMIIPLAVSVYIASHGWRDTYAVLGLCLVVLFIAAGSLLRRDPLKMGLLPDGDTSLPADGINQNESGFSMKAAIRTWQFWTVSFVIFGALFGLVAGLAHIVPHTTDIGIEPVVAASILSTIGGVSIVGRFLTGISIDRFGSRFSVVGCLLFLIAGLVWLQSAEQILDFYLFGIVFGIALGGIYTCISPMVAEYFGLRTHGELFGIVAFLGAAGGSIGSLMTGYIFDVTANYSLAFWICTAVASASLGLILILRPVKFHPPTQILP